MSQAVHWNADFLNTLVTRVNTLKASAALVTTETKQALEAVNELNVGRDSQLRQALRRLRLQRLRPRLLPAATARTLCGSALPSMAFRRR